jgi:formylglycine-generating enzyme required for sulfatase activity
VLPAGEFMMGSTHGAEGGTEDERPQHRVTIGQRFAIGQYPVTFDEYDRFCAATPRENPADAAWGRARRPVINVNWDDAHAYIAWLSQETGHTYRLLSEVANGNMPAALARPAGTRLATRLLQEMPTTPNRI